MRFNCAILDPYDRSVISSENGEYITSEPEVRTLEKQADSVGQV